MKDCHGQMKSITPANILRMKEAEKNKKEAEEEALKELNNVVNRIASTPDGLVFFRHMRSKCGVDRESTALDPQHLAGEKALRGIFLHLWNMLSIKNKRRML